jgi:hypothetical protein
VAPSNSKKTKKPSRGMMGMGMGKGKGKGRVPSRGMMMGKGMTMGKGSNNDSGGMMGKGGRVVDDDDDENEIEGKGSSRGMGDRRPPRDPKSSKKKKERNKIKRIKHKSIFDFLMDEPRQHLFGGEGDENDDDFRADDFLRDWQESRIRARNNIFARKEGW